MGQRAQGPGWKDPYCVCIFKHSHVVELLSMAALLDEWGFLIDAHAWHARIHPKEGIFWLASSTVEESVLLP